MNLDHHLMFCEAQAITGDAKSQFSIPLDVARDIGAGNQVKMFVQVDETMADSGSNSTVAVALVTDDNAELTSVATVRSLVTFAAGTLAGTRKEFTLESPPLASGAYQAFIGLSFTLSGGDLSAGKFTAGIVNAVGDVTKFYPRSSEISV